MGKIFQTPEVVRVFCGSYWPEPLVHDDYKAMFGTPHLPRPRERAKRAQKRASGSCAPTTSFSAYVLTSPPPPEHDEKLLVEELKNLPSSAAARKINDMVKRIRLVKVHVCILSYLKSQMPLLWGKQAKQEFLIANLDVVFDEVKSM
jgi:hypothetical protein